MRAKVKSVLYLDIDGTVRHGKDELGFFVSKASEVATAYDNQPKGIKND